MRLPSSWRCGHQAPRRNSGDGDGYRTYSTRMPPRGPGTTASESRWTPQGRTPRCYHVATTPCAIQQIHKYNVSDLIAGFTWAWIILDCRRFRGSGTFNQGVSESIPPRL